VAQPVNQSIEQMVKSAFSSGERIIILGVGSSLNCDDGAGPAVAENLINCMNGDFPENMRVYNGCASPENLTGEIKRFSPNTLIIIDAADFSGTPGSIKTIDMKNITGTGFSSHMLPVSIMADYLEKETGCKTIMIGIQPASILYGNELSEQVASTVRKITKIMMKNIKKFSDQFQNG